MPGARVPGAMPICRFAAEPPQGGLPPDETLQAEFLAACLRVETEEGDPELGTAGDIHWFPDRTWSGRTYVPATPARTPGLELFGYVSFAPGDEPSELYAWADYTRRRRRGPPGVAHGHLPGGRRRLARRARAGGGDDADLGRALRAPRQPRHRRARRRAGRRDRDRRASASRCSRPTPTTTTTSTSCCGTAAGASWCASRSTRTRSSRCRLFRSTTTRSISP